MAICSDCGETFDEDNETQPCCPCCGFESSDHDQGDLSDGFDVDEAWNTYDEYDTGERCLNYDALMYDIFAYSESQEEPPSVDLDARVSGNAVAPVVVREIEDCSENLEKDHVNSHELSTMPVMEQCTLYPTKKIDAAQSIPLGGADLSVMSWSEAVHSGECQMIRTHVLRGVDVNMALSRSVYEFPVFAACGHEDAILELLAAGAKINSKTSDGYTLLHLAAQFGYVALAKTLLSAGVDIEARYCENLNDHPDHNNTPLHMAIAKGNRKTKDEIVGILLDAGADVGARGGQGRTALHFAAYIGHDSIVKRLISTQQQVNMSSAEWSDWFVPLINVWDQDGSTPLHLAASNGRTAVVKTLLAAGADVTGQSYLAFAAHESMIAETEDGATDTIARIKKIPTALHLAAKFGHEEVVKLLIEAGANIDARTNEGFSPLHFAFIRGHNSIVQLLCDAGSLLGKKGDALLFWAARRGYVSIVKRLLSFGIDVGCRGYNGCTPLHWASFKGHLAVVKALIESGADINAKDRGEWSPLYLATVNGQEAVVKTLIAAGAEPVCLDS